MTLDIVTPTTKAGLFLIVFVQIIAVAGVILLPKPICLYLSALMICANVAMMIVICQSLTRFGVGRERTQFDVFSVGIFGVVALPVYFSAFYKWLGIIKSSTGEITESYFDCIYFSVVTWTTLGYGDFVPSDDSQIAVIIEVFLGYTVMSLFIASIVVAVQKSGGLAD